MSSVFTLSLRAPMEKRGTHIQQIRRVASARGGRIQASDLVKVGWDFKRAAIRLAMLVNDGRAKKHLPTCLPGTKYEPSYQIDLNFL